MWRVAVKSVAALLVVIALWAVAARWIEPQPRPFVTAAPGTVGTICFSTDFMAPCQPGTDATITSDTFGYSLTVPNQQDVRIDISRIDGSQELKVFELDIGTDGFGPGDEFGSFSCGPCQQTGDYVGRARYGDTVFAEGFFHHT
jgi:hypothetical protein